MKIACSVGMIGATTAGEFMANHRMYQYTSIGRPIELSVTSVRVLMALMPVAAVLGAVLAISEGYGFAFVARQALMFALAVYGSWALARELDPDDTPAAFIGLAAAMLAISLVENAGILVVYVTLALVRIVNRSSGLAARLSDSIIVMLATIWLIYATDSPLVGLVAALAFIIDGSMKEPTRRQWIFGLVCAGATMVYIVDNGLAERQLALPASLFEWMSLLFILIFALDSMVLNKVRTTGDVSGRRLDPTRVRAGMAIGFLAALQGVTRPETVVIIVATIAGLCFGMAFRKGFKVPAA